MYDVYMHLREKSSCSVSLSGNIALALAGEEGEGGRASERERGKLLNG
jgi:hypothetical protein